MCRNQHIWLESRYLQAQVGGRTHAATEEPAEELSPGRQIVCCPALQVTVHLRQGGGPCTLHEDGFVMSHSGVALGDATGGAALGFFDEAAIAGMGASNAGIGARRIAINRSIREIIKSS